MILKPIYLARLRLNKFWVGLGIIGLSSLSVAAQVDTLSAIVSTEQSKRGTIKVVKPEIKPIANVTLNYILFSGKPSDSPSIDKTTKGVSFVGDKTNVLASGAEYPEPAGIDLATPDKYWNNGSWEDNGMIDGFRSFDFNTFFTENLAYTYPYSNTPKSDTVQLIVKTDKNGVAIYSYRIEKKNRTTVEKKCFEVLGHITGWKPAKLLIYKSDGSRLKRKKKINGLIYMTVVITAQPGAPEFDALWEEAGK